MSLNLPYTVQVSSIARIGKTFGGAWVAKDRRTAWDIVQKWQQVGSVYLIVVKYNHDIVWTWDRRKER